MTEALLNERIFPREFAALLGPGFFALLQTSIHRGFRAGMCLSIGIFLSDVFVLLLCYFGSAA